MGRLKPLVGPKQVRAIQTRMASLGQDSESPDEEAEETQARASALRVTIQYQRKGRGAGRGEFSLSAEDVEQWFAGAHIPPEFEQAIRATLAERAAAKRELAKDWLLDRLGIRPAKSPAKGAPV